jgi:hypothetical protein
VDNALSTPEQILVFIAKSGPINSRASKNVNGVPTATVLGGPYYVPKSVGLRV